MEYISDCLTENLEIINLFQDFWFYQKKSRDLFYELESVKLIIENLDIYLIEGIFDKIGEPYYYDEKEMLIEKIDIEFKKFTDSENELIGENKGETTISRLDILSFNELKKADIDFYRYIVLTEETIKFSQKIKSLLIKCYYFINEVHVSIIDVLAEKLDIGTVKKKNIQIDLESLKYLRSREKTDRDKIVTYKFIIDNKDFKSESKFINFITASLDREGYKLPYFFKQRNYDYYYKLSKKDYSNSHKLLHDTIMSLEDYKKEKIQEKRNNIQYYFNIVITISTIISLVFLILSYRLSKEEYKDNLHNNTPIEVHIKE